jgi:hypothetical protein
MNTIKKQARFAGLLYLVACLPAPFALIYVPNTLIVPRSAHLVGQVTMILELAQLPIVLWLLIWGAREQPLAEQAA